MEGDRARSGYDQIDEYTQKNATIGIEPPPSYEQAQPNAGGSYPQQPYIQGFTNVVVSQPQQCVVVQPRPFDWIVPSILACLFCFWPTGIFAIAFAAQAYTLWNVGDYEVASKKANYAKYFTIASVVIGIICIGCIVAYRLYHFKDLDEYRSEEYQNDGW